MNDSPFTIPDDVACGPRPALVPTPVLLTPKRKRRRWLVALAIVVGVLAFAVGWESYRVYRQQTAERDLSVMWAATDANDVTTARRLLRKYPGWAHGWVRFCGDAGQTYLHDAAQKNHLEMAALLLEKGADVNAMDIMRSTPLMYAVKSNASSSMIVLLLQHGARINTFNEAGNSPLLYAAVTKNEATCRLLLAHGADPTLWDAKWHHSAITCADIYSTPAIRTLLRKAAKEQQKTRK